MKLRLIFLFLYLSNVLFVFAQDLDYEYHNLNQDAPVNEIEKYINNVPEDIYSKIPEEIKNGIKTSPLFYLDKLIGFLISWTDDDFLKVKSIHDWICLNIGYDILGYNSANIKITAPAITLKNGNAVCGAYAVLFNYMAVSAGFESYIVKGYVNDSGKYSIGDKKYFTGHAWNCIKIKGRYYLIDTTWDAGYVNNKGFSFSYQTDYFLSEPSFFIQQHYPEVPAWLLTEKYISITEFRKNKKK